MNIFTSLCTLKLIMVLAIYIYATPGQKEKYASPLCSVKNQPFKYIWQNKMCCDILFSFCTFLCNKSAVLLGNRTQLSNELHTIFHYSFFPSLLVALHSENAFCLRWNGSILILMSFHHIVEKIYCPCFRGLEIVN